MKHNLLKSWLTPCTLVLLFAVMFSGCLESTITTTCTSMAETRCQTCFSCEKAEADLSGASLCQLTHESTEEGCVEELVRTCESQTNARQLALDTLEACDEALQTEEASTCEPLYEHATQGHTSLPSECLQLF